MQYGHFDDSKREYVIETPMTPLPWINYLGNKDFFSLVSQTLGGFTFYKDAKLRRLTRHRYNDVPRDNGGRLYYIKDGNTVWNPGFLPSKTPLDSYRCRHGLGYSIIESKKNGIMCSVKLFNPLDKAVEINQVKLENKSSTKKNITLFSALEWCFYNAEDDATNFQRNWNIAEVEVEGSTIYHTTEYRERRNHYAFFSVNSGISSFDTDRDHFLGTYNGWDKPDSVEKGEDSCSIAHGWAPIASHCIHISLAPGECRTFVFLLGYVEQKESTKFSAPGKVNKDKAYRIIESYDSEEKVQKAFGSLQKYWHGMLGHFQITTDEPKVDRMVNIWNQYQCMVTFNLSRSTSYYESGLGRGMGFRDSCQDIYGFVHMAPERARQRILDLASVQFADGSTFHQYQPLTGKGNADIGGGFNDDPLWLIASTIAYLKETGDFSILDESIPFVDNNIGTTTLLMHLERSFSFTLSHKGPHGLPLIGRADWNDCLNLNCFSTEPGESFQTCSNYDSGKAESVFIAGMFVLYGRTYAQLLDRLGKSKEAQEARNETDAMEKKCIRYGWDGNWFIRAYDALGGKVGSKDCAEGKIFIEPQGFCTMAGIGEDEGLGKKAMSSVWQYLVNDFGIELIAPPYSTYHEELGEISSYPPGYKENGSVFCHNNPWVILAESKLGHGNEAYSLYCRNSPAFTEEKSDIHRSEPYCYSQTIAGRQAPTYGEAKNSWLTGTAAWSFVAVSQGIFGIKPDWDGLLIDPCLPDSIGFCRIIRQFRGTTYEISIDNSTHSGYQLTVDGERVHGKLVRHNAERKRVDIKLSL